MTAIRQEEDQVIVGLHGGVVMRDDDILAADHGAQSGALGQRNIFDAAPDDLGAVGVAVDHHLERLGRAASQRVHAHHVAAPYMRQQRADGHGLRRDGHVDGTTLDQFGVRGLVDQGHDLVSAQALGEHGRENIRLLRVRQRREDIRAVDVLFEQQFLVGRIAVQDGGALQLLRDLPRPLAVALDELHLVPIFQFARQTHTDVAAAGDDHAASRRFFPAHLLHDHANVIARRQEKYLIAVLDHGVALGLDALAGAVNGRNPGVRRGNVLPQSAQCLAYQGTALQGANADQAHPAVGEIQHLQGAGIADQARDVLGDQLFGADPYVHRDGILAEQLVPLCEVGGSHARDFLRGAVERPRDVTGQHVDLIAVGQSDENVGGGDARGLEDAGASRVAVHGTNVEAILQIAQNLLVRVDDGHVIRLLPREVVCRRAADLPCAQNDDFHELRLLYTNEVGVRQHEP